MNDRRCGKCDLWTHDSGDVSSLVGKKGYSVCGANLFNDPGKRAVTHKDDCCNRWRPEEEEPELTDKEIEAMLGQAPEGEDDLEGVKRVVKTIQL